MMSIVLYVLVPTKIIQEMLPSTRMHPYRVTPSHCVLSISAFCYKKCDVGPYNEVSVGIPFYLDKRSPLFVGLLRRPPEVPFVYIKYMPVTSDIARKAGIERANFPKFLALIDIIESEDRVVCTVDADNRRILKIECKKTRLVETPRQMIYPITLLGDRLLRLELVQSKCLMGTSRAQQDVSLEIGDHQIGDELKALHPGRILQYQYCPSRKAILSIVSESYVLETKK
jgi:hypothetical protein